MRRREFVGLLGERRRGRLEPVRSIQRSRRLVCEPSQHDT
jgi:hypothetical protein